MSSLACRNANVRLIIIVLLMHCIAFCIPHFVKECFEVVNIQRMWLVLVDSVCRLLTLIWLFTVRLMNHLMIFLHTALQVSVDSLSWEFHVSTLDDSNITEPPKVLNKYKHTIYNVASGQARYYSHIILIFSINIHRGTCKLL